MSEKSDQGTNEDSLASGSDEPEAEGAILTTEDEQDETLPVGAPAEGPSLDEPLHQGRRWFLRQSSRDVERSRPRRDGALGFRLFVVLLFFAILASAASLKVRPLTLPIWAVSEVETRMNDLADAVLPGSGLSLGGMTLMVDDDWSPILRLTDMRLSQSGQIGVLALPSAQLRLDGGALWSGDVVPRALALDGAHLALVRDQNGLINLRFGASEVAPIRNLDDLFDRIDRTLARPELRGLERVELGALSLTVTDQRAGRTWSLGDGRLVAENADGEVRADFSVSVLGLPGGEVPRAQILARSTRGKGEAEITGTIADFPSRDLAVQLAALAPLEALDAPISGQVSLRLTREGVESLSGRLGAAAGALRPNAATAPIAFSRAGVAIDWDGAAGRMKLSDLHVESASLRLIAAGQTLFLDATGRPMTGPLAALGQVPKAFLTQLQLTDLQINPAGQFQSPVNFSTGAIDLRLTLDPFKAEIGQFSLTEGTQVITVKGAAEATDKGWKLAMDVAMNEVTIERLLQIWPVKLVPKTREWVERNILTGQLTHVEAAMRLAPGQATKFHLGYDFNEAEIVWMASMPPIRGARGYSVIDDKVNTGVLTKGTVTAPEGGVLDVTGTALTVADIYALPATGQFDLRAKGPGVAVLSLLDQPPFGYLTKAGRPVALGSGEADLRVAVALPLKSGLTPSDVDFKATGVVRDFVSDVLVDGYEISVPEIAVVASPAGMEARGKGNIDGVAFDAHYHLPFLSDQGSPFVEGTIELSHRTLDVFEIGLSKALVRGEGLGQFRLDLPSGQPAELEMTSDTKGMVLTIPELGWTKGAKTKAALTASARLTDPPQIDRVTLNAPGLKASGTVTLSASGGLEVARFSSVEMGAWLDGAVEIRGTSPLTFAVTDGTVDFRRFPDESERGSSGAGGGGAMPVTLALDQFRVTDSISIRPFRGRFRVTSRGLDGEFSGNVGGDVPIEGAVTPAENGTAVRVTGQDAGGAIRASGMFASAVGGTLDMVLNPRAKSGVYDGRATITNIRVQNANVLAELLNAISVVGLLEQLNGQGILFANAEADFVMQPDRVTLVRSSAVGASMGVSLEGTYYAASGALDMGGVLSPIYILNGVGAILTRKGEGLFGFTYRLGGTADAPQIGVNPLSILTPAMFREIFRFQVPNDVGN